MTSADYYYQTPIMKRTLEYLGEAVYVKGSDPNPDTGKRYRRFNDIIHAMGDGVDLHRSNIDFNSLVLVLDIEYGNKNHPGEIFHKPLETFAKMEPTRENISSLLEENGIESLETMTGQGYNYAMSVPRDSQTYSALLKLGKALRVMPWTAAKRLLEKQDQYENLPLLRDHVASTAFGRLNDHIFDRIKNDSELEMKTSDIFDEPEISIFDTTQHGYLLNRRAFRIAYSLHQKFMMHPKYNYQGPAIVTLPSEGIPLEERVKIRQDERDNYGGAVELARGTNTELPSANLTSLITDYLLSETFERHKALSQGLGRGDIDSYEKENVFRRVEEDLPGITPEDIFWDISDTDWGYLGSKGLDREVWEMFNNPNDRLLVPGALRFIIKDMKDKGIQEREIISAIANKYDSEHGWPDDLWKNDSLLRAEYWLRTLEMQ